MVESSKRINLISVIFACAVHNAIVFSLQFHISIWLKNVKNYYLKRRNYLKPDYRLPNRTPTAQNTVGTKRGTMEARRALFIVADEILFAYGFKINVDIKYNRRASVKSV